MRVGDAEWRVLTDKIDRAREQRDGTANVVAQLLVRGQVEPARRLAVTDYVQQSAAVTALWDQYDAAERTASST